VIPNGSPGYFSKSNWGLNTRKYVVIAKTLTARRWTNILAGTSIHTVFLSLDTGDDSQTADNESQLQAPDSGMLPAVYSCSHSQATNNYLDL
jgi:hypothetical protein